MNPRNKTYNDEIVAYLQKQEIPLFGFADLSEIEPTCRQNFQYGICFAIPLTVFPETEELPSRAYYDEYRRINRKLKETSLGLEELIHSNGYLAYSLARNRQNEDFRTVLPFKTLATRAGLGWIGKSSLLVTRSYGAAVRLNGVITNLPLQTAEPVNTSFCGNCRCCVEACPAQALTGNHWSLDGDRNDLVDPIACKQKVIERGEAMGVTVGSCGICLAVCPWTKRYIQRMTSSPVVEEAPTEDYETIVNVIHRSFSTVADEFGLTPENCPKYTGFLPLEALNAQKERGWNLYQCRVGQKVVGCMALSDEGNGCFELHELAVLPEYRHFGYGTQLLKNAGAIIKASGGNLLKISILEENTRLKNWYMAKGFVHVGTRKFSHLPFTSGYLVWNLTDHEQQTDAL